MGERLYHIADPDFGEFVFNCMATASTEDRRELSPQELLHFATKRAIRRFADNETMERRLLMLARLGIQFCVICAPKTADIGAMLDEARTQYMFVEKRLALTQAMAKNKVFVISSNNVVLSAHMAAQNSHGQIYTLNYNYVKLHGYMAKAKARDFMTKHNAYDFKDGVDAIEMLCSAAITIFNTQDNDIVPSICGVSSDELKLLMVLFIRRNTFTGVEQLQLLTGKTLRGKATSLALSGMEKKGYIAREPGYTDKTNHPKRSFMIISKGIDIVMNYIKYLTKETFK